MITRFAMLLFRPESISEVLKNIFSGYVIKNITKRIDPQTKAQIKYILSCEFIPNNNKEEKLVRKLIGKFN